MENLPLFWNNNKLAVSTTLRVLMKVGTNFMLSLFIVLLVQYEQPQQKTHARLTL
jgi:hypothetical protein